VNSVHNPLFLMIDDLAAEDTRREIERKQKRKKREGIEGEGREGEKIFFIYASIMAFLITVICSFFFVFLWDI